MASYNVKRWQCRFCDSFNDPSRNFCEICEAAYVDIKDEIPQKIKRKVVEDVKNESKKEIPKSFDDYRYDDHRPLKLEMWKCNDCSHLNSSDLTLCSRCSKSPRLGKWRCNCCTMLNDEQESTCSVCFSTSPLVTKCPACDKTYINIKFKEKCDNCIKRLDSVSTESRKQTVVTDDSEKYWSCSKCSFKNSSKMDNCTVCGALGPSDNRWSCQACSFKNNNNVSKCIVCDFNKVNPIKEDELICSLFMTNFDRTVKVLTEKFIPIICEAENRNISCRQCTVPLHGPGKELCGNCLKEYYICECKMIVGPNRLICAHCGSEKYCKNYVNNEKPEGWKCSWMKCFSFNNADRQECQACHCPHDVSEGNVECVYCGWVKLKNSKCIKCGTSF